MPHRSVPVPAPQVPLSQIMEEDSSSEGSGSDESESGGSFDSEAENQPQRRPARRAAAAARKALKKGSKPGGLGQLLLSVCVRAVAVCQAFAP